MADEEYSRKLQSMQQYIPFLEVMIAQLRDPKKKNREQQLQKMESLYAMITDKKKKLKFETLVKCEDVIKKIQEKVTSPTSVITNQFQNRADFPPDMQKFICKNPPEQSTLSFERNRDEQLKFEVARAKLQQVIASPSPPKEIIEIKKQPVTIPLEKVSDDKRRDWNSNSDLSRSNEHTRIERPDIYSSAVVNLDKSKVNHPRVSVFDRLGDKLVDMSKPPLSKEDLELLQLSDTYTDNVTDKSLDELEKIREKLYRELDENKDDDNSKIKKPTPQSTDSIKSTSVTAPTTSSTSINRPKTPRVEKVVKEPDTFFGSVLSSLDGKLMEEQTKKKDQTKKSSGNVKDKKNEKDKRDHKSDSRNYKSDDKSHKDHKSDSKSYKSDDKSTCKTDDRIHRNDSRSYKSDNKDNRNEERTCKIDDRCYKSGDKHHRSDDKNYRSEDRSHRSDEKTYRGNDRHHRSDDKDRYRLSKDKEKCKDRNENKNEPKSKEPTQKDCPDKFSKSNPGTDGTVTYKRLADKYNPKPRKHSIEEDVEKQIEEKMQQSSDNIPKMPFQENDTKHAIDSDRRFKKPTDGWIQESEVHNKKWFVDSPSTQELKSGSWFQEPSSKDDGLIQTDHMNNQNKWSNILSTPEAQPIINNVVNQLVGSLPQLHLNTNLGNMTPRDTFLNSPPISQNFNVPILQQNQMMQKPFGITGNFSQPNQFGTRNPLFNHSANVGGNTFVNNYIIQQQKSPNQFFNPPEQFPQKKSFNPYEPIGEHRQTSPRDEYDLSKMQPVDFYPGQNQCKPSMMSPASSSNSNGSNCTGRFEHRNQHIGFQRNIFSSGNNRNRYQSRDDDKTSKYSDRDERSQKWKHEEHRRENRDPRLARRPERHEDSTKPGSKHDQIYSNIDKVKGEVDGKDSFSSPLNSLYTTNEEKTGKGYGVQKFKIPKIKKPEVEEKVKVNSTAVDESKELISEENTLKASTSKEEENKEIEEGRTQEKVEEKIDEKKATPTEQTLLKEFVNNLLDITPDKNEVLLSLLQTLTGTLGEQQKKKFKKIKRYIESDTTSDEEEVVVKKGKKKIVKKDDESSDNNEERNDKSKLNAVESKKENVVEDKIESPLTNTITTRLRNRKNQVKDLNNDKVKTRQQTKASTKPKVRRYKSELDMLHDDIKDMFIRDGVLTATGKRMCCILKESPDTLKTTTKKIETSVESNDEEDDVPLALRMNSSSDKSLFDSPLSKASSLRVVLEKTDLEKLAALQHDSVTIEEVKEIEEKIEEIEEETKKLVAPRTPQKKKKKSTWSMGFIKKKRKTNKTVKNDRSSIASSPVPGDDVSSFSSELEGAESEQSQQVSIVSEELKQNYHNKNYYFMPGKKLTCKLCGFQGKPIIQHYKTIHQQEEVLISRLSPKEAKRVMEEAAENPLPTINQMENTEVNSKRRHQYQCPFCNSFIRDNVDGYYDHLTSHTGEYRYHCLQCRFQTAIPKSLRTHLHAIHGESSVNNKSLQPLRVVSSTTDGQVFGFLCRECHFVQTVRESVEEHIKSYHINVKDAVVQIKLSKVPAKVDTKTRTRKNAEETVTIVSEEEKINEEVSKEKENNTVDENIKENVKGKETEKEQNIKQEIVDLDIEKAEEKSGREEKDSNVFMSKTDILKENQRIEEERLEKMREINAKVKRTNSNFIEQLKSKLNNQRNDCNDVTMEAAQIPEDCPPSVSELCRKVAPKTALGINKLNIEDSILKKKVPISGIIQRLQGNLISKLYEVNENVTAQSPESREHSPRQSSVPPPPELIDMSDTDKVTVLKGSENEITVRSGPIVIRKKTDGIEYACFILSCTYVGRSQKDFEEHILGMHSTKTGCNGTCDICFKQVTTAEDVTSLFDMARHLTEEHVMNNEGRSKTPLLRARRLSGDILSDVRGEIIDEDDGTEKIVQNAEDSGFPFLITSVKGEVEDNYQLPVISNVCSLAEMPSEDQEPTNESQPTITTPIIAQIPPLRPFITSSLLKAPTTSLALTTTNPSSTTTKHQALLLINPLPPQQNLTSFSTPPPLTKTKKILLKDFPLTAEELRKPKKSVTATLTMLQQRHIGDLYKCPSYDCKFSTNARTSFECHLKQHSVLSKILVSCLYCNFKTEFDHVVIHIDVRHGNSRFACQYCFYRAFCETYVEIHQLEAHVDRPCKVISLPVHKDSMHSRGHIIKPNLKSIILPYKCGQNGCLATYLTKMEFINHLTTHCLSELTCSICSSKSPSATNLVEHYATLHGYCYYNCTYCKKGGNTHLAVYKHLTNCHFGSPPDIVCRIFATGSEIVAHSTVTDDDYQKLHHNKQEIRMSNCMERPFKLKGNLATKNIELVQSESPIILNSYLSNCLKDEPLVNILSTPNEGGGGKNLEDPLRLDKLNETEIITSEEDDPLRLDNEPSTSQGDSTRDDNDAASAMPHIFVPSNFSFMDESDSQDADFDTSTVDVTGNDSSKEGLIAHDLYECVACKTTFRTSTLYKSHLNKCTSIKITDPKPYACKHCIKTFKNGSSLVDHIRIHGASNFRCSLCEFKHPYLYQVRSHMKSSHKITSTLTTPFDPKKNDVDTDDYVVRPKVFKRKSGELSSTVIKETAEELKVDQCKSSYEPSEIDQLPRQAIYNYQIKCSVCGYTTKVRTNLVRHLEFHLKEKEVPTTAPVNPVPCLEKNEKMFDKMTNLAISSMTGASRMGVKSESEKVALSKEEESQLPAFVPSTKRFVCGVTACNYLCLEESGLRFHLSTLHTDETVFTCTHCKEVLTWEKGSLNTDHVMKHMKLHDQHLYKCGQCRFVHNLKHKVERHMTDKHVEKKSQIVVVREMETEVEGGVSSASSLDKESLLSKEIKSWCCGMCKYRSSTMEDVSGHAMNKHNIDSQYKCTLCKYKSNFNETFLEHFADKHKNHDVDFIDVFYRCNAKMSKQENEHDVFDTTPLWQRDRPRVRHIRGILLEDCKKISKKSPIKLIPDNSEGAGEDKPKLNKIPSKSLIDRSAQLEDKNSSLINEINTALKDAILIVDDENECVEDPSVGIFGPFGSPLNNMYSCPLCSKFNSVFEADVAHHLYQELEYYRYKCPTCNLTSITFTFMCDHSAKKHKDWDPKTIVELPKNPQIEAWVKKVLEVQKGQMSNDPSEEAAKDCKESQKFVEYETVVIGGEDEEDSTVNVVSEEEPSEVSLSTTSDLIQAEKKALQKCPHCPYQCKAASDMRKHEKRHWLQKPLKCGHCDYEGVTRSEITSHNKRAHKDIEPIIVELPMPKDPVIIPIVRKRKATSKGTDSCEAVPIKKTTLEVEEEETDKDKSLNDTVYVCKYCPKRGESVMEMCVHWENTHKAKSYTFEYKEVSRSTFEKRLSIIKCSVCNYSGNVDTIRQHYLECHPEEKNYAQYKCSECGELFFKNYSLKSHFLVNHPLTPFVLNNCRSSDNRSDGGGADNPNLPKKFKCSECGHTSNSYNAMKDHLRSHAKPYKCFYCELRFNYPSLVQKHQQLTHPNSDYKFETLDDCVKENAELRRKLLVLNPEGEYELLGFKRKAKRSLSIDNSEDELLVVKKMVYTARKKTIVPTIKQQQTARKSTTFVPIIEEGYSYYGQQPEALNLKKITTSVTIGGKDNMIMTIEQFANIFDMFPKVVLVDCNTENKEL